jgi:hypothetical protein
LLQVTKRERPWDRHGTYWGVGRRIVEEEQHGGARAEYGEELISKLSADLQARFGPNPSSTAPSSRSRRLPWADLLRLRRRASQTRRVYAREVRKLRSRRAARGATACQILRASSREALARDLLQCGP